MGEGNAARGVVLGNGKTGGAVVISGGYFMIFLQASAKSSCP